MGTCHNVVVKTCEDRIHMDIYIYVVRARCLEGKSMLFHHLLCATFLNQLLLVLATLCFVACCSLSLSLSMSYYIQYSVYIYIYMYMFIYTHTHKTSYICAFTFTTLHIYNKLHYLDPSIVACTGHTCTHDWIWMIQHVHLGYTCSCYISLQLYTYGSVSRWLFLSEYLMKRWFDMLFLQYRWTIRAQFLHHVCFLPFRGPVVACHFTLRSFRLLSGSPWGELLREFSLFHPASPGWWSLCKSYEL